MDGNAPADSSAAGVDSSVVDHARAIARSPIATTRRLVAADDLLQHGSLLAAAAVASGGLNYAYQVFMGRALGPESYGVFGALFALFYLLTVLGRGIRFSASRFVAELAGRQHEVAAFHRGLALRSFLFGCGLAAVLVATSPAIAHFLGVGSAWPVVIVAATIPLSLAFTANQGALQGLQWFAPLGGYKILQAAVKLVAGVALVVAGYGVLGAFGALALAMLLAVVLTALHLRVRLPPRDASALDVGYDRAYRYAPPAILAGFCLTVPANVDVILVKHFFSGTQAGHYAAAAVLGKILLFMPMGISTALFPKVTSEHAGPDADRMDALFDRALLYSAAIAGTGAAVYWFLPRTILSAFFGSAFVDAAPLLQWYGVAILGFVLAVVVLNFELARDRTRFVYLFAAVSIVEIGAIWLLHGTMVQVIQILLAVNGGLLLVGILEVKR